MRLHGGKCSLGKGEQQDQALGTLKSLAEEEGPAQKEAKPSLREEENKESVVLGKSREEGEFEEWSSASNAAEKSKQSEDGEGTTGFGHMEATYFLLKATSVEIKRPLGGA